ncbi:MAG: ATP synthase F1 subunit gamma [Clostridia bacterium]
MEKNINELREHIGAIKETRQITNAMYLLSASRMKKIMPHVDYNREYFSRIRSAVKDILFRSPSLEHDYLRDENAIFGRRAYLILAADKGMAGGYNHNVLQFALEKISNEENPYIATIGIYASEFFKKKGYPPDREFLGMAQNPSVGNSRALKDTFFELYNHEEIGELNVIYTRFDSPVKQYPWCVRLLPLTIADYQNVTVEYDYDRDMIYHPSPETVFFELVPQYAVGLLYGALSQSYASEHCARMNAMQSATKNADDLIKKLQYAYHSARQLGITQELTEIVAAGFDK